MNLAKELIKTSLMTIYSNKVAAVIFSAIVVIFNIIGLATNEFLYYIALTVILLVPLLVIAGFIIRLISFPLNRTRRYYYQLFENMNFKALNGEYPHYIGEEDSEYLKVLTFQSQIPLKEWLAKQPVLETYLTKQIAKMCNNAENSNVVHVLTVIKPLPETIAWDDSLIFKNSHMLNVGVGYDDEVFINLNRTPHAFIAGETGSGKSNILKCLIYQCIVHEHEVKLIDFKRGVSFAVFDDLVEIYADYEKIMIVLDSLVKETNRRLDLFRDNRVEDLNQYNNITGNGLKRIVVFIDELAELMRVSDKQASKTILASLETLTRLSRAVGINLIMGIQRPDATIINGQIKNNVSMRICGRFVDPEPSRIMLGDDMAARLPSVKGRFIMRDDEYTEFQAYLITKELMGYLNIERAIRKPLKEFSSPNDEPEDIPEKEDGNSFKLDFNFDDVQI